LRKSLVCSTEGKLKLRAVILLSLPAIVGTGLLLAGVIASKLHNFEAPPVDFFREPTYVERVALPALVTLYMALYFGAAIGPLLLPFAGYEAFSLTRAVGVRSRVAIWAWTFVVLGLVVTALLWGWLTTLDIFI
jgi:hypothetical protein